MEDKKVLLIIEGIYLVRCAIPEQMPEKDIIEYVRNGYTIKTISLKEFRETDFKWIYEKRGTMPR